MEVKLYKCSDDKRVLNKTLDDETPMECDFLHPVDLKNPILLVSTNSSIVRFNYAYINLFHRYYFIENMIARNASVMELHLSIDVLQSYKDQISEMTCYIERAENFRNEMLLDGNRPIQTNCHWVATPFGQPVNRENNYHLFLTTGGGR